MSDYDPGAGLSEASAFEERMEAGWYDEPPDDDYSYGGPKRSRCLICDKLDHHVAYVRLESAGGRFVANFPLCRDHRRAGFASCVGAIRAVRRGSYKRREER